MIIVTFQDDHHDIFVEAEMDAASPFEYVMIIVECHDDHHNIVMEAIKYD